jgi:hypothetical protein
MVYLDDTASLYVRRDGPNADLAARGYRLVSHLTVVDALIDRPPPADDLSRDARLAVAQAPRSARAHLFAACAALARRDVAGAASERDIAKAIDRDAPGLDALDQRIARFAPCAKKKRPPR